MGNLRLTTHDDIFGVTQNDNGASSFPSLYENIFIDFAGNDSNGDTLVIRNDIDNAKYTISSGELIDLDGNQPLGVYINAENIVFENGGALVVDANANLSVDFNAAGGTIQLSEAVDATIDSIGAGSDTLDVSSFVTNGADYDFSSGALLSGIASVSITGIENFVGTINADIVRSDSNDNTITGGGADDTFVFDINNGNDTITDFTSQSGAVGDVLDLSAYGFNPGEVDLLISDNGVDTTIDLTADGGGTITLLGVIGITEADDVLI